MAENLNYYWQSEFDRKNREAEYNKLQSDIENGQRHNSTKEKIEALEEENANLKKSLQYSRSSLSDIEEYYKNLLTKPFKEIAEITGGDFEKTYDEQQTILGEWMVSQRAFKEIAIKYGIETGKVKEEIIQEGMETEVKVLNNQTEYGNHLNDDEWTKFYAPKIKAKLGIK